MDSPFLGLIQMFGFNFAPRGWATCDGQLQSIAQNTALFSLLGTTYGGDGRTTFALPDLRGRVPVHMGTGPGLPNASIGERAGQETITLNVSNLPAHNHGATAAVAVASGAASTDEAAGAILTNTGNNFYAAAGTADGHLGGVTAATANTGNNAPVNNMQPYLVVNFCIALQGIFPSRS